MEVTDAEAEDIFKRSVWWDVLAEEKILILFFTLNSFDTDESGSINMSEFLIQIRPPMNESRLRIIGELIQFERCFFVEYASSLSEAPMNSSPF